MLSVVIVGIRDFGLNVYYVPSAEVVHHGGGSSRQVSVSSCVWMRRSVYHLILTHHGQSAAVAYRMLMGISSMVRLSLLAPACIVTQSAQRAARLKSFLKWAAILRWCAGFENAAVTRW
jgi:GT2 family glycosyltransferase